MNNPDLLIENRIQSSINTFSKIIQSTELKNTINQMIDLLSNSLKNDRNILACGNGGSICDATHFCQELTGRYERDRPPLGAISLNDVAHLTCVSNDYSYEKVFSRQVSSLGKPGDCLLSFTTSGNSQNVIEAIKAANDKGIHTITLTGKDGGKVKDLSKLSLIVPSMKTSEIQEAHIKIVHIMIEGIENNIFGN